MLSAYFASGLGPPQVLMYERTHLLPQVEARLAAFLRAAGMVRLTNRTEVRSSFAAIGDWTLRTWLELATPVAATATRPNFVWVRHVAGGADGGVAITVVVRIGPTRAK
mmetsp:Transcript_54033/g.149029  ORF Transcript_54033/g.149029 Transcript_54033/m.149029 type:complete len:109 (+) Transcript_54033:471-797(+)